jgi:hypothetical protein
MYNMERPLTRGRLMFLALCLGALSFAGCSGEDPGAERAFSAPRRSVPGAPVMTPDTQSLVAHVQADGVEFIIRDGETVGRRYERVMAPVVSENGSAVAFIAWADGAMRLVWNGKETELSGTVARSLALSPDGRSLAYVGGTSEQVSVIRDGAAIAGPYSRIGKIAFSPDGRSLVFDASDGETRFIVRDGVRQPGDYDTVWDWTFLPDGGILAAVEQNERSFLIWDGVRRGAEHDTFSMNDISRLRLSADGQHVAYVHRKEPHYLAMRDGEQVGEEYHGVGQLAWADKANVLAFTAVMNERMFIVRDGIRRSDEHDEIGPMALSPDGQRVAYWARRREGSWNLYGDTGLLTTGYDSPAEIRTSQDGARLVTAAVRGRTTYRIELPW